MALSSRQVKSGMELWWWNPAAAATATKITKIIITSVIHKRSHKNGARVNFCVFICMTNEWRMENENELATQRIKYTPKEFAENETRNDNFSFGFSSQTSEWVVEDIYDEFRIFFVTTSIELERHKQQNEYLSVFMFAFEWQILFISIFLSISPSLFLFCSLSRRGTMLQMQK